MSKTGKNGWDRKAIQNSKSLSWLRGTTPRIINYDTFKVQYRIHGKWNVCLCAELFLYADELLNKDKDCLGLLMWVQSKQRRQRTVLHNTDLSFTRASLSLSASLNNSHWSMGEIKAKLNTHEEILHWKCCVLILKNFSFCRTVIMNETYPLHNISEWVQCHCWTNIACPLPRVNRHLAPSLTQSLSRSANFSD